MTNPQRVGVFLLGVVLGMVILTFLPRPPRESTPVHPWHAQTAPAGTYPLTFIDGYGRSVVLPGQPRHLISLAPSVTEVLFAMGMGDHLKAVTDWCQVPQEASGIRRVGSLDQPNREIIAGLQADLVLGSNLTPFSVYQQFADTGQKALALNFSSLEQTFQAIRDLGKILGVPGRALELKGRLQQQLRSLEEKIARHRRQPPWRVLLVYDPAQLSSAGRGSWVGDLLNECGVENLAARADSPWPRLSAEAIIALDPEIVLWARDTHNGMSGQSGWEPLRAHPAWQSTTAVRENRLLEVDGALFLVPGPRMVETLEALARAIYPDFDK